MSCGECNVISFYFLCCSVNGSVYLVCYVFDRVCEFLVKQSVIFVGVVFSFYIQF